MLSRGLERPEIPRTGVLPRASPLRPLTDAASFRKSQRLALGIVSLPDMQSPCTALTGTLCRKINRRLSLRFRQSGALRS